MDYVAAVTQAASALRRGEEASWELAQLTWEHTVTGRGGDQRPERRLGTQPSLGVPMAQWCADVRAAAPGIKFSEWSGKTYKRIWDAYGRVPAEARPSWTEAYYEQGSAASPSDRERRATDAHLKQADPERKRELFFRLAHDPDLADAGTIDQASAVLDARAREVRGMPPVPPPLHREHAEAIERQDPVGVNAAISPLRLAMYVLDARVAAQRYAETLRQLPVLTPDIRELELTELATVVDAWTRLRAVVAQTGAGSVVGAIETFLTTVRTTE